MPNSSARPRAVIVDALRTPIGRHGGALASVRPDDLAALVIQSIVERTGVDPALIDDVISAPEGIRIAGSREDASLPVNEQLRNLADVRRNIRDTASHCVENLERREIESLDRGIRSDGYVHAAYPLRHVLEGKCAGNSDAPGQFL